MEKTNFTSYSSWKTTMMQRLATMVVALCCLGLQVASAGHVYTPIGAQTDTPYDANDPATYSVAQPNQTVLFANGITTVLTAQGMNCGTNTYPFADAGGVGGPFSDELTPAAFTVCPNSPMNQAIGVTFNFVLLGAGETLEVFDGDDTDDTSLGLFTGVAAAPATGSGSLAGAYPVTVSAGASTTADGTGCLTFQLDNLDGLSDAEGFRASLSMSEFANAVAVTAAPDEITLVDCEAAVPNVTLTPSYDCGTRGNPFFKQRVTVNGTPVPFRDGVSDVDGDGDVDDDDIVPASGTGVSATPGVITVLGTQPGPDNMLGTADDIPAALGVGSNRVCVNIMFDDGVNPVVRKAQGCDDVIISTRDPLACNDDLNIGLDADCVISITPDVVLEAPCGDPTGYVITLTLIQADRDFMNPQGIVGNGIATVSPSEVTAQIPGRYRYSIELGGNKCWGFLNLEDKRGPVCRPAGDNEIPVIYDRDCDGDLTTAFGGAELVEDPSGNDDLLDEYVLCTVLDAADAAGTTALRWDIESGSFIEEGSGIFFDYLEAMDGFANFDGDDRQDPGEPSYEGDFFDCTGIATIFYRDELIEVCELSDLNGIPVDLTRYDEDRFEICTVETRTWFAIDKKGFQSQVGCSQRVFGLRPKASEIRLEAEARANCTDDVDGFCFQQSTAPYFFVNGGIDNEGQGSDGPTTVRNVCAGANATVATSAKRFVLAAGEHTCKYAVSYHEDDQTIVLGTDADGNASCRKQTRYWSVIDWCDGDRVYDSFAQLIKIEDNAAPTLISQNGFRVIVVNGVTVEVTRENPFTTRPYVITFDAKLFDCEASGNLPAVTTRDNCSANEITRITIERTSAGTGEPGEDIFINNVLTDPRGDRTITSPVDGFNLTLGTYDITYFYEDDCGNATSIVVPARFDDGRAPSAICNDELVVTLVPTGQEGQQRARVYGEDLDDTSRDNCWPVLLEVRKGDGSNQPWTPWVEFTCDDITDADADATIKVELRVTEDRNGNGRIDGGERSNICWTFIRIEDKTPPIIAVADRTLDCDDPRLDDLQLNFGSYTPGADNTDPFFPAIVGGCTSAGITIQIIDRDLRFYDPVCKVGQLFRRFRAVRTIHDNQISGNSIWQTITVRFKSDWTMQFPADVEVVCDDAADSNLDNVPAPLRVEDIITNRGCDQWGMEVDDEIFDIIGQDGDGACFKIVRTYKFINWCTWDPTNSEEGVVPRPLDFFTNASQRVVLDYRSNTVTNICALRNEIDDRFERVADRYDLLNAFADFNPNTTISLDERDGDAIYFDETVGSDIFGDPLSGQVNAFLVGDCIAETDAAGNTIWWNAETGRTVDGRRWAEATGNDDINDGQQHGFVSAEAYGYFIYRQVIKVTDNEAPVIDPIDDFTVCDSTNANGNCTANVTFPLPEVDECKPTYRVFWQLDAGNNGTVDLSGELGGNAVDGFTALTLNNLPYGTHGMRYVVRDGCGNSENVDFDFSIMDCKAPTAYCVIGVNIELMPTGMVEVWASDVDAGSFDDCSEPVTLSFSPNPADSGLVFTCDQRGSNFVQLWVTDAAGNQSFCETIINVQSNDTNECTGGAAIAGGIATEMGDNVEGAEIRLSGAADAAITTDVNGTFGFDALVVGSDYTITPEKDVNYLNGVSTFDLVLIRKHIIGTATLDSPYKLIAADVNNSQTITTFDMIELRKLILNIDTELESNTSWRFVDASYAFPNPANPWMEQFPEVVNFNDIQVADNAANFVAIKVGDVNNSATPNLLLGSDERTSNDAVVFNVADAAVAAGEEVTVDFTADMVDVEGYQFTLNFDNNVLDLVEIVEGAATAENFGTTLVNEGTITTSFDGEVAADQVLFSLTFAAKASANLSELISVSSAVTAAEAYKANEVLDVALNFGGATQTAGFELFQNTPNPFNGVTTISFNLPTAASATLTVSDVTGKVISVINGDYAKGLNQVQFTSNTATGVLYYTLETADFTATKKMIIVE